MSELAVAKVFQALNDNSHLNKPDLFKDSVYRWLPMMLNVRLVHRGGEGKWGDEGAPLTCCSATLCHHIELSVHFLRLAVPNLAATPPALGYASARATGTVGLQGSCFVRHCE